MGPMSQRNSGIARLGLLLARLVLTWVFIRAALPKIQDPLAFAGAIEAFQIVGGPLALWVALILPWLELVVALGLLTPWLKKLSASLISGLLLVFISLHASAWARGLDINCGCFGVSESSPDYLWLILRNLGLFGLAVFVLWCGPGRHRRSPPSHDEASAKATDT